MKYLFFSIFLLIFGQLLVPRASLVAIVWLIPLMLRSFEQPWTFVHGLIWGLFVFGFHLSWLLGMLISQGTGLKGILVWIIALIWFACSSGIWLRLTRYSWMISTMMFFVFLTQLSLLPCGELEGYPFMNPLISLAVIPELLQIIYYIGDIGGFLLIISFSWFMAWAIQNKDWKYGVLSIICLLPFVLGLMYTKKNPSMDGMTCITPWWHGCKNPMFAGYRILDALHAVDIKNKPVHTFIMPESTFCFDLQEYQHFISIWCDGFEGKNIILGSHRPSDGCYKNSVFMLRDGVIIACYDKQHLMPFVERNPCFFDLFGLMQMFPILAIQSSCIHHQDDIVWIDQRPYQLFLCSELFFQVKSTKQCPVLLLWNDSWLYFEWTKKIAMLFIDYFAVKNNVEMVHASTQGRTNII